MELAGEVRDPDEIALRVIRRDVVLRELLLRLRRRRLEAEEHRLERGAGVGADEARLRERGQGPDRVLDGEAHLSGDEAALLQPVAEVLHGAERLVRAGGEQVRDVRRLVGAELELGQGRDGDRGRVGDVELPCRGEGQRPLEPAVQLVRYALAGLLQLDLGVRDLRGAEPVGRPERHRGVALALHVGGVRLRERLELRHLRAVVGRRLDRERERAGRGCPVRREPDAEGVHARAGVLELLPGLRGRVRRLCAGGLPLRALLLRRGPRRLRGGGLLLRRGRRLPGARRRAGACRLPLRAEVVRRLPGRPEVRTCRREIAGELRAVALDRRDQRSSVERHSCSPTRSASRRPSRPQPRERRARGSASTPVCRGCRESDHVATTTAGASSARRRRRSRSAGAGRSP